MALRGAILCLWAGVASVPAWAGWSAKGTDYVEGEVLVTFKASHSTASARGVLGRQGLSLTRSFDWLSGRMGRPCGLVQAKGKTTAELIALLEKDPSVERVEPNYKRWVNDGFRPNDPLFGQLWGLQNTGQVVAAVSGTAGADIAFPAAWRMALASGSDVVVAVIDTGVDYGHPDLAGNMWANPGEIPANGADDDGNGYVDDVVGYNFAGGTASPLDSGDHGTHVSGTIAASGNNATGGIGVAYQARVMALQVSSDGESIDTAAEIAAIQYASMMKGRGVHVAAINASFGGGGYSGAERSAIVAAGNAGIVFCAAAGNDGLDNDVNPTYPASYRLTNMIVVAASDQNDALAGFSNRGAASVDLAAPGVNILSTMPTWLSATTASVHRGTSTIAATGFLYAGVTTGVTGAIYYCGLGYPADFPAGVNGHIALIQRGTLYFYEKVSNAKAAGARAAIIYNNASGPFSGTLQTQGDWIPAVSISSADGSALRAALPATGTVVNAVIPSGMHQLMDGTSMATPHVAGAVAFAAMNYPGESATQRVQRILNAVDVKTSLTGKVRTGGRLNLKRTVDGDGNNLPDWWEQLYLGQPTGGDPTADPDRDGMKTIDEWIAGTDPSNAVSCLRLMSTGPADENGFTVSWQSVPGKAYRLDRATNLVTGFNSVVRTTIVATAAVTSVTDTNGGGQACYYKVSLEP